MVSRREFMGKIAAAAALVCVPETAGASSAEPGRGAPALAAESGAASVQAGEAPLPWGLLRPLGPGSEVGHGWRIHHLTGVKDGSFILTLRNQAGSLQRVRVCRNDGHPEGIVHSAHFDLLVINGGKGDLPTHEGLAQAVAQMGRVLAGNEEGRLKDAAIQGLLPHSECIRAA